MPPPRCPRSSCVSPSPRSLLPCRQRLSGAPAAHRADSHIRRADRLNPRTNDRLTRIHRSADGAEKKAPSHTHSSRSRTPGAAACAPINQFGTLRKPSSDGAAADHNGGYIASSSYGSVAERGIQLRARFTVQRHTGPLAPDISACTGPGQQICRTRSPVARARDRRRPLSRGNAGGHWAARVREACAPTRPGTRRNAPGRRASGRRAGAAIPRGRRLPPRGCGR